MVEEPTPEEDEGEKPEFEADLEPDQPARKPTTTDKVKDAGGKAAKKGAKNLAKKAGAAVAKTLSSATGALASYFGWPVLAGCLVVFLIILLVFGGLACLSINGYFGKTLPMPAGKDDPNVIALIEANDNGKLVFTHDRDREFLESGQIDRRLAAALNYLVERHEHIRISHIVSAYEDMKVNPESGSFHDQQISKNVSAHKNGLAADIDQIDLIKEKCDCGNLVPVNLEWQTIDENPYGEVPDALDKIKSPEDFANEEVKNALEELGVTGLDQDDLIERIKAIPILAQIDDVQDLTNPQVIAAFEGINVYGLNNENLQKGLKRIAALQSLYELNLEDISALQNPQVQSLFNEIGVPISDETIQSIEKFQAVNILQSITSLEDLEKPEIKAALEKLGLDAEDLNLTTALGIFSSAGIVANWDGAENDAINNALAEFGLDTNANTEKALNIFNGAKTLFTGINGGITSEAQLIYTLEQLAIDIGNPEAQEAVNKFKAAYAIVKDPANFSDSQYLKALNELGIGISEND